MKKVRKTLVSIILIICFVMTAFTGCSKSDKKEVTSTSSNETNNNDSQVTPVLDTSEKIDLVFYLMGEEPIDIKKVQNKINEILLEKVNATVTFKFTTWTDWQTKYNMILSSGEDCDLIYTASWTNYSNLATNKAFAPLDEILPTYAPELYSLIPEEKWNQVKINGSIYAVPSIKDEYTNHGLLYREDLREKYNLPVPDSLENLEAYLAGVKENEPDQPIMRPSVNTASFVWSFSAVAALQYKYGWVAPMGLNYGLAANYNTPSEIYNYWSSQDFRDDMKMMKRWADKGFWSKSVLSDANDADAFKNGQEIATLEGVQGPKYVANKKELADKQPDWEIAYIPYATKNGVAYTNHATQNCTAIPINSKNPERAAMVLNLLYMDKELNNLIQYGIEGTHYSVGTDGIYVEGPSYENFQSEGANAWNLRHPEYYIPREQDAANEEIFAQLKNIASKTNYPDVDIASGFIEVFDDYAAERAALASVMTQYLAPIQAGLVDDVDAAVDVFLVKAEEAGLSKIQNAYTEQWKAYCDEYGYK